MGIIVHLVAAAFAVVADAASRAGLHRDAVALLEVLDILSNCTIVRSHPLKGEITRTFVDDTSRLVAEDLVAV